ncbi:uncharacterized protein FIBRA_04572 [Fibroporia radiculosa]|uniref:AB hydrolase-1 domain-containing protein n=1 Tax=Fibroporia radiculosa TaxID=599839 RepID=J4HWL5_9APHY|nr:uncharacterized protein FIBRA_04572 [Fibroporia radiculosa]CCM02472.1 predicted protein [Fibroporia radiculosa]
MPLGPVSSQGISLYYEDALPPGNSTTYVTVFLVHGTMFHSAIFRRLIPYAVHQKLRLVLINLRDYPESTRYTPRELQELASPDQGIQATAIAARGLEIAEFIRWFIETKCIPAISKTSDSIRSSTGGFSLLGWSSGNCQTIPLLAHADKTPEATRRLFDEYFRTFIIYDMSSMSMGEQPPDGLYEPFNDEKLSNSEKESLFPLWVSSYFTQITLPSTDDSESPMFTSMLLARTVVNDGKGTSQDENSQFYPTAAKMTPELLAELCDSEVMARSQDLFQRANPTIYQENIRRALFQCPLDAGGDGPIWTKVRVHIAWCDMATSDGVFAANRVKYRAKLCREDTKDWRRVSFHKLERANHFMHWDDPERFTKFLGGIV